MGNAGTLGGEFRTALRTRSFVIAMQIAKSMPHLTLTDALDLTLLAAEKDPERYRSLAQRFLIRLIEERDLSFTDIGDAARQLAAIAEGGTGAEVRALVRQRPLKGSIGRPYSRSSGPA
jgi:hypothetical protein